MISMLRHRHSKSGSVLAVLVLAIGLALAAVPPAYAAAGVTLDPTSYDFGERRVGLPQQASFTVTSTGVGTVVAGTTVVPSSQFSASGCGTSESPIALPPGESCTITVTFAPTSAGAKTATMTVVNNGSTQASASLFGTGVEPTAILSVASLDFGAVQIGAPSAAQTVTLSNSGSDPLTVNTSQVTGDFSTDAGCDGVVLEPSASCDIEVTFTPTAFGPGPGTLTIPTELGDRVVDLSGSGSDTTAPTVSLSDPTAPFTLAASTVLHFTGQDPEPGSGVDSFQVRRKTAPWNGSFGDWEYPTAWNAVEGSQLSVGLAVGRTSCFAVRSRDAAGNLSTAWSATRCTARPLDDRSLAASSGWTRATSSAYYLSTITSTARQYAVLTRTSTKVSRVALVATKCPTCGVVGVYVGSTLIGKVSLARSTTANRVLIVLPAFTPRSATVTIKVLSSGKPVRIDGLGIYRAY